MKIAPLHPRYGLTVHGVDLRDVTANHLFPEIRRAFDTQSALLFPAQSLSDADHVRLATLFGPVENRDAMAAGREIPFVLAPLSNTTTDGVAEADSLQVLSLRSNMLWHTDSTFLPVPALVNILTATVVPSRGGETELASTRAAWADMPEALKDPLREAIIWHRFAHSRAKVSAELAASYMISKWPDRPWRAVWRNPVTGDEALYIASHSFAIEGMGLQESQALLEQAIEFCTQAEYVYTHRWQVGDVLIWDERATLHRGRPWPYAEPRTLKSICCSATDADGLATVRIV